MINLQDSCGLPLIFNTQDNTLHPAGEICFDFIEKVKLDAVRPTLLNKTLRYPLFVYAEYCDSCLKEHKAIFEKNKLHYSIIVLPPGLLGIEYNKTHIFAPDKDRNEITAIVDVVYGSGLVLIQRVKEKGELDFETEVEFVAIFRVKKGDRVPIPQKYMYTFINPRDSALITTRIYEDDGKIDYRSIRREQGMSYYFIRKNARREIVRNPRYKNMPDLQRLDTQDYAKRYRLTSSKPIYTQFIQNPTRFKKILV